ncbi:MAG TPA: MBL fold metallo-hydrolase [Chloroflexia bacterium]|nr:MBL fold metallo-hydrolase [Chloroflexia bacterium]
MPQSFDQLTPFLWVAQSRLFYMNSGVIISDHQACLVDPGIYPDELDGIAHFVQEQGASLQSIVLTHSHWDHVLGPERFPGVKIIAQEEYAAAVAAGGAVLLKDINQWVEKAKVERATPFEIPPPTETFGESMELQVGSLTLWLVHTPGHAPDELAVYHADSGTLWASDILSDIEIPFVTHSLIAYQRTLARLAGLDIRVLVPGHGCATTAPDEARRRLAHDITYLAELRVRVEQAIKHGLTLDETVAACATMPYRHRQENEEPHRINVQAAYAELAGPTALTPDP